MANTDYEELFDDVMRYASKKLGRKDKFNTKEDLRNYLEDSDSKQAISHATMERLIKTDTSKTFISPDKATFKDVLDVELSKREQKRIIKAQKEKIDKAIYTKWRNKPSSVEVNKLQPATKKFIITLQELKTREYAKRKIRVYNYKNTVRFAVKKDKINRKYAVNIVTGRRVNKNIYSKFSVSLKKKKLKESKE